MNHWRVWLAVLLAAGGSVGLLWFMPSVPIGVPGEWTWLRIQPADGTGRDLVFGALAAAIAAAVYCTVAWQGAARFARSSKLERAGWLVGLVVAGFAWLWVVQQSPPVEYGLAKAPRVLFYPGSSGYYYKARYEFDDVSQFLAGYEELMAEGDVLHVGTHPPGLFLLHRGLIVLCRQFPALADAVLTTQPHSVDEAFGLIEQTTAGTARPFLPADRAPIWLAALLTQLVGVAAVIPLYCLVSLDRSRETAWQAAAFWPLVPALAAFLPKSDALFPFLGLVFLVLWISGWRQRSAVRCLLAGLVFWGGMFFSLALLPVGLLAGLLTVWESQARLTGERPTLVLKQLAASITWGAIGFAAPIAALWVACDVNLLAVWKWNYANHEAFYAQSQFARTYWKWLLVNPLELTLAVGAPLMVLAVAAFAPLVHREAPWRDRSLGPYWACGIVWAILWLSGKNMGEAARLWLFLMPWPVWLAAGWFASPPPAASSKRRHANAWIVLLALQAALAIATVTRVYGFSAGLPEETSNASIGRTGGAVTYICHNFD